MASEPAEPEKRSSSGWKRIRDLVPKPSLKPLRKTSSAKRAKPIRRRPAYPPGYKYGYHDSLHGPPKFERVNHWPYCRELSYYFHNRKYRCKEYNECEITRQLPLCQQRPAVSSPVLQESTGIETADPARANTTRPCRSQKQSRFFTLPPEIRLMIYAECFGSTLPVFSPLKYKTRDETRFVRVPSRLSPLLTCHRMHDEALPALRRLLRDLSLCGPAALYLPWSMPLDNLAYIRSLEIDFFFISPPNHYALGGSGRIDPLEYYSKGQLASIHSWYGMWDVISNYMPSLDKFTFNGHLLDLHHWMDSQFSERELDMLRPLTWLHGPDYHDIPKANRLNRSRRARPSGGTLGDGSSAFSRLAAPVQVESVRPKAPSRLKKLNLTLLWREGQHRLGDSVAAMLAADGCDVDVSYLPLYLDDDMSSYEYQVAVTFRALENLEPALMKSDRKHYWR